MMDLLFEFKKYVQGDKLFAATDKLLIAVSGGIDSAVLCSLCHGAGYKFAIAHCNFQLRGDESVRDEAFVKELANKYQVAFHVERFDTKEFAAANKLGIQEAARKLRYDWFGQVLLQSAAQHLFTAHHANDQVETLLFNFFRGTGLKGMQGILPKTFAGYSIVRPLLFATRQDIISYANELQISFVEDSSNSSDDYTRNYFRHQLLPLLQNIFPHVEENLLQNIDRFSEAHWLYRAKVDEYKKKLIQTVGNEIQIPVNKLLLIKPLKTILYEIIKDYGFTSHQLADCVQLLKSETGRYIQSEKYRIIKNREWLIISPQSLADAALIVLDGVGQVAFCEGVLQINLVEKIENKTGEHSQAEFLDASKVEFPLMLRPWKIGDYFYPLGMQKKKKLSRFFIDQKLSKIEKEKIWVIESHRKIICILGRRIDDRFKVMPNSTKLLKIEYQKK